ncbi:hypothetical protein HOA92_06385 [archaeon]|jgi:hypothetical protein|nr:hypothetical protein [archaeon]MBT6762639.1 hypothetical protein [archaeon]
MPDHPKSNPNQGRIVKCTNCKELQEHHAKGMCAKCYKKQWVSKQIITCEECKRTKPHHSKGLCDSCYGRIHKYDTIKRYNIRKYYNISLELYRQITIKCVSCLFAKIVELHHLDGDKKNNNTNNLVGLCPNCHKMIHTFKYYEEIKSILGKKGFPTEKIHPSSYVKARKKKNIAKTEIPIES